MNEPINMKQLATLLSECRGTLHWYSVNANGNSAKHPDDGDTELIGKIDQALADFNRRHQLTWHQRQELLDKLTSDRVDGLGDPIGTLYEAIRSGIPGFASLTDAELLEAHEELFGYDFLEGYGEGKQ